MSDPIIIEIIGGGIVALIAAGLGAIGWLVVRADRKQEQRMGRIYDRLDALEQASQAHDRRTAVIETKVDTLMADHTTLLRAARQDEEDDGDDDQ